jgi:hypothetical protein
MNMLRSQENLILGSLYYEIIEEGRKERYLEMFRDPYFDEIEIPRAKRIIKLASDSLRNPNAVMWILRDYRDKTLEASKLNDEEKIKYVYQITQRMIGVFNHYESLGIAQIDNYNWPKDKSNQGIETYFKQLEKKWLGDRKEWVDITDELRNGPIEKILDVGDNFAWYNLNRRYCRAEGDAMGHCGNAGSPSSNDTVLSLRKTQTRGNRVFARPSLTFIYDTSNGALGEMKGRANEKPKAVYHPYIIKLLLHKVNTSSRTAETEYMVKHVVGGGYAPENNFEISDLSPALKKQLYDIRPELKSLKQIREEMNDDAAFYRVVESRLASQFPDNNVQIVASKNIGGVVNVHFHDVWEDWESLFRMINVPRNLEHYTDYVDGSDSFDFYGQDVDDTDMVRLLARAIENDTVMEKQIADHIKENYDKDFNIFNHNTQEVFEILLDHNDDIIDTLRSAVIAGSESGAYDQMLEYFKDGITELELNLEDDITVSIYFENPKQWMDSEIGAVMNLNYLLNNEGVLATDIFENIRGVDGDMELPYYGFYKYDRDAAFDYFKSNI